MVEDIIKKERPSRGGRELPIEPKDFAAKNALYLPEQARYSYLVNLPDKVNLKTNDGKDILSLGQAVNYAMKLVEEQSEQLKGVLPKSYTDFDDKLLAELLRIFNNETIDKIGGDIIGRIYEYFLSKFAKAVASDDGVFFTPKSLVKMLVNVLEPTEGIMLDPACGSGGMFVQSGDFVNQSGQNATQKMTFYGQEKVEYNANLCLMNMAVHGLSGKIVSGDAANTFYHDAHNLAGKCDYVIANPPFNVDKVKEEAVISAGRLPLGKPGVNAKTKEFGNANYLWINYFYAYLNDHGRAGFVMASSATDSANKDRDIRENLVKTGNVDVMVSVGNNFFYMLSLPCSLWFFDKAKRPENRDKVLFIDARNYYTVVDRTLNEWTEWQLRNLQAIVFLYRGETDKYLKLLADYNAELNGKTVAMAQQELDNKKTEAKQIIEDAPRKEKKKIEAEQNKQIEEFEKILETARQHEWLIEKFGIDGTYRDVLGLCKIATINEIAEKIFSLTPGAYVGVAEVEDDGIDFHERMSEIHSELARLNQEANTLMDEILKEWEEMR